jgi:hypothetical protein
MERQTGSVEAPKLGGGPGPGGRCPRPGGPLGAKRRDEPGRRLEGLRILTPRGTGLAPEEQTFRGTLLHFAAVTGSLEIEQKAEAVTIILGGDEVQIYYPGGPRVRQGVLVGRLEVLTQWRGDELVIQEKNEFGTLAQRLSVDLDGRLSIS